LFKLALFLCSKFEFEQHEQADKTANHTYTTAGTYTVTLTVKHAADNIATHQITVTVEAPQA
jgi:PKD repeat protein